MRTGILILMTSLCLAPGVRVSSAEPSVGTTDPRNDYHKLQRFAADRPPEDVSEAQRLEWLAKQSEQVQAAVREFSMRHPHSDERWEATVIFARAAEMHPSHLGIAEAREMMAQATKEAPLETTRDAARLWLLHDEFKSLTGPQPVGPARRAAARRLLDGFAEDPVEYQILPSLEMAYMQVIMREAPEEADEWVATLRSRGNQRVTSLVERVVVRERWKQNPLQFSFTAFDGRRVDFAELRGKIVILDFWSTSIRGRMAELAPLQGILARHADAGLVVIGICADDAGILRSDLYDDQITKIRTARAKLSDFLAKNSITWPQHFDGLGFQGPALQQLGAPGLPSRMLLDREGRLAATDLRGVKLEQEVKRLLGL